MSEGTPAPSWNELPFGETAHAADETTADDPRNPYHEESPASELKKLALAVRRGALATVRDIEEQFGLEPPDRCPHCKKRLASRRR